MPDLRDGAFRAGVVIGLDVGTTAVKAVGFGLQGARSPVAVWEYPLAEPQPGAAVADPDQVLAAVSGALAACVRSLAGAPVAAVAVSTAMHGLVALDPGNRPLTPVLTWADGRAGAQAAALHRDGSASELHRLTGTPVHPMSPLCKIRWLREEMPGVLTQARWLVGLKEWVLLHLTARVVTDRSSASGTGLWALTGGWAPPALAAAGISEDALAPVVEPEQVLALRAEVAAVIGLPAGTPVVAGGGDGPVATLGVGALAPGSAGLSLGTSGAVRAVVDGPRVVPGLFCYALSGRRFVLGGAISNGGSALRWAGGMVAPGASDAELGALAGQAPAGCDGLVMVPWLLAERAPLWDAGLPGSLLGLRRRHGPHHLLRAALEGVCLQLGAVFASLEHATPLTDLRVTGGACASSLWTQTLASVLDRDLLVSDGAEGTARGAAALALVALGVVSDPEGAGGDPLEQALGHLGPPGGRRVVPDPHDAAVYRDLRATVGGLAAAAAAGAAVAGTPALPRPMEPPHGPDGQ